jgi:F0F1-type ATP synthase assembly protein I
VKMGACFSQPSSSSENEEEDDKDEKKRKRKKKTLKKTNKNRGKKEEEEEHDDDENAFERAMMSSEYSRLQTIKRERAKQRTLSECEKLDVIADALANIEREKKELANARRHLRDMNRAAKAAAQKVESDGLGGGTVGIVGSSARRGDEGGAGIVMSSGSAEAPPPREKKSTLSKNETTSS